VVVPAPVEWQALGLTAIEDLRNDAPVDSSNDATSDAPSA